MTDQAAPAENWRKARAFVLDSPPYFVEGVAIVNDQTGAARFRPATEAGKIQMRDAVSRNLRVSIDTAFLPEEAEEFAEAFEKGLTSTIRLFG